MRKFHGLLLCLVLSCGVAAGQTLNCSMQGDRPDGLKAAVSGGALEFTWQGESGQQLRAQFTIVNGQPTVQELAAQNKGGQWVELGKNLVPEFKTVAGKRRMSVAQATQFKILGIPVTQQLYDKEKWMTFWDAPLVVPGVPGKGDSAPLPRSPDDIHRDTASYKSNSCKVTTDGAQMAVTFDGLAMGIWSGDLRFTVYKGSNLLRQEAIAKTELPGVAYIYSGGLKGFPIGSDAKVVWRDNARQWQNYQFGGAPNTDNVGLRARDRMEILAAGGGSLAVFPPPHKFFFARENEVNLGYVYYRKDNNQSFALGVMQPEKGEGYHPWGVTDEEWKKRTDVAQSEWDNFALYNGPAGTLQRMAVYYYLSPEAAQATQQKVMAYTHDDVFKPVPGFKVLVSHFHFNLNEMLQDRKTLDYRPPWVDVFHGLGVNIAILGDFHGDGHANDPGPLRFNDQKWYYDGAAHISDKDFLIIPGEEPDVYLGGHWWLMTPKPVYFSKAEPRPANQPFIENDPKYGTVYHLGSSTDVLNLVNKEQGILWTTHPRTKNTAGYPDAYKDKDFFLSDRHIGASWEGIPTDLSESRLCEVRCFGTQDDMSNWAPTPKVMLAEGDTYNKWPDDETYPQLAVNYIKLDRVPAYADGWAPVVAGMRKGSFFGTTGEVLFHNWGVEGAGPKRTYTASIEYTFPLQFAELVWGDGNTVNRQIINLTDTTPFGTKDFKIPFDATGKKWIRFAVWDSAGNGAFVQPIALGTAAPSDRGSAAMARR